MPRLLTIKPSIARLRRGTQGLHWENLWREFFAAADERLELSAGSSEETYDALCLPDELTRILGVGELTPLEEQISWLSSGEQVYGPTVSYRFDDALLADETIYAKNRHFVCGFGPKRPIIFSKFESFDAAQFCGHSATRIFFGHWLQDAMCLEALAADRQLTPLSFRGKDWLHEPGYREILDLPGRRTSVARVSRLWLVDDRCFNSGWSNRFRRLRRRVRGVAEGNGPTHVFLSRGMGGAARDIKNKEIIAASLSRNGFTIVEPELMEVPDLVRALGNVRVLVAAEGSNLSHAQLALPEGAVMVVIQPPKQFNAYHKLVADIVGLRFAFVVGDVAEEGFTVDEGRLLRLIDLVERI